MKTRLEEVKPEENSSYTVSVNPKMSGLFYWHFHPEFELVFIKGANSNRHVGKHLSRFIGSDLVFIGSYIPHLNFDYGVKTNYEKIVIHLREDFLSDASSITPELENVRALLELSKHGIAFGEQTKKEVENRIFSLPLLSKFDQFLEVLAILNLLMKAEDKELLHKNQVKNQHTHKDHLRLKRIYQFIDNNYERKISVGEIAESVRLSDASFCRYFKKMTKLTFTKFVNHYRIEKAKKLLMLDVSVTETCYSCGFESLSYFNRTFKGVTGKNPQRFKSDYIN